MDRFYLKMRLLLFVFLTEGTLSAPFFIADQCINICKDAKLPTLELDYYEQVVCQRGCRFFNIIKFKDDIKINATKRECHTSCEESYSNVKENEVCKTGCSLMAKQQEKMVATFLIEEETSIVLASPEREIEFDLLSDPSIKSQLEVGFNIDYKIPETRIRTMPIKMTEITVEEDVNVPSGDWLDCAARNSGIPRWMLLTAILSAVLIALWLSFSTDKKTIRDDAGTDGDVPDDKLILRNNEVIEKDPVLLEQPYCYHHEDVAFLPPPPYKEDPKAISSDV